MNNIPCKECICLPICKVTYNTRLSIPNEYVNSKALALNILFNKCSILDSYIINNTIDREPNFKRINKLHKFFG